MACESKCSRTQSIWHRFVLNVDRVLHLIGTFADPVFPAARTLMAKSFSALRWFRACLPATAHNNLVSIRLGFEGIHPDACPPLELDGCRPHPEPCSSRSAVTRQRSRTHSAMSSMPPRKKSCSRSTRNGLARALVGNNWDRDNRTLWEPAIEVDATVKSEQLSHSQLQWRQAAPQVWKNIRVCVSFTHKNLKFSATNRTQIKMRLSVPKRTD